jgi:hypothetical protein
MVMPRSRINLRRVNAVFTEDTRQVRATLRTFDFARCPGFVFQCNVRKALGPGVTRAIHGACPAGQLRGSGALLRATSPG